MSMPVRVVLFLICLMVVNTSSVTASTTILKVGGTGSSLGFMKHLAQQYRIHHPDIVIKVLPSLGSTGGLSALHSGVIDLAVASRPLTKSEKKGVRDYSLGTSPFVFAVHPATEVNNITASQLTDIYIGRQSTWPDGTHIRRILRPVNDTDWQLMQTISPEVTHALEMASHTEGLYLAVTDNDAVSYLERVVGSFGPTTLATILAEQRQIKVLSFEGISPAESVKNMQYQLYKTFRLVVRTNASAAVTDFLDFIFSDHSNQVLSKVGIVRSNGRKSDH